MSAAVTALAVDSSSRTTARLTWTDGAGNDGVEIYKSTSNSLAAASFLAVAAQGAQLYKITALQPGTTYYFWARGRVDGQAPAAAAGSVNITTLGNAGNPGDQVVQEIIEAAEERVEAVLSTDWHKLDYIRDPRKNSKMGTNRGWGIRMGASAPGEAPVFGAYTQTFSLDVVLMMGSVPGKGDSQIQAAEFEAMSWADRFVRDFLGTRLYLSSNVLRVADPSIGAPEYLQDTEAVLIVVSFPVQYRNRLRP